MGEPDYKSINELKMQLYANAGTVSTTLGGGMHGHVGLIMDDALYQTVAGTTYTAPSKPMRTAPRTGATTAEQETAEKTYKDSLSLKNKYTGYLGVEAKDMMDHLLDRYGKITPADIVSNSTKFQEGINMGQPIDAYFTTINDCIQCASDAKAPYTTEQIMVNAENAIKNTVMTEQCFNIKG
eukprot:4120085-Ditylum_brightwellii.AAC.1